MAAVVNAVLLPLAVVFFFLGMLARIDSHEELICTRVIDVIIGLMLAVSFALAREAKPVPRHITIIIALTIWLLSSGLLLSWHALQVYARTTTAEHAITRSCIVRSYKALEAYSGDCGVLPSDAQSLDALFANPGLVQWTGPYLTDEEDVLDAWGHRLLYALRDGRPVVWSCGEDGVSGTDDDVDVAHEEAAGATPGR